MATMSTFDTSPTRRTGPSSTTAPSSAQIAVDRAIADLRRGGMVILRDTDHHAAIVIQAAEMATHDGLRMLMRLTGSQPTIALTRNRAAAIKPSAASTTVQSLLLPMGTDADVVHQIADPTFVGDE
ncbi:MAG: hypothetical protein P8N43_13475, partial [Alphaproteobacteria bacterium]|nr:hypothetical protein [Alphaproteobacteria bacterium]